MIESVVEDVEVKAKAALRNSPIYALRGLHVRRDGTCLLLSGQVDSFYHKQLAQEAVRAVAHGCQVVNSVRVD
ncbi:MAG: BON domain-containing protein [Pirellulaceae bacterium]|nr:BON domain-containing protein [Pirellulaceae bacterium]